MRSHPVRAFGVVDQVGRKVVRLHHLPPAGWQGGERLRRPGLLARHVARGHGTFFDRPHRLAGHALEDEHETLLRRLRDGVYLLAVLAHGDELRRGGQIVIPQIVMDRLEMPQALAGARVEREQAVAEEIRADAVRAVVVVGRRRNREIGDAALRIERDLAPHIDAARVLPGILGPGVVAELARLRNGVEGPHELAGDDVVGAHVTGSREIRLARRAAEQDQVLEHASGRRRGDAPDRVRIAPESLAQIDDALLAERRESTCPCARRSPAACRRS